MDAVLHDTPDYVARARSLGPLLAAAADKIERNRELPASVVSALIDNGLFRLLQPRSLGGAELDPMTYIRVVEEIASHDASTGWCVEQANGCSMAAAFLDPEVAQEIFGPPDGIVAWGPVGPAELCDAPGGFRLTGAWNFASGSHHASWLGAHVVMHGPDGAPLCRADGGEILRTLLFPKSQATMTDIWHVVGLRGTGSDQAREVVNTLYHSAGATAIFDDRPFERRFRDMHTASQQAQGRQAHFETIGRVLFGLAPDTAMFAF